MKPALVSITIVAFALSQASAGANEAEGMLLCHIVGVDNTVNNVYWLNGPAEAERKYAEAHALPYELESAPWTTKGATHPFNFVANIQGYIHAVYFDAKRGVEKNQDRLGGAFIYDIGLSANPDGSVAGEFVRGLLPDMVTCQQIDLDG
ncbi:hypothetical protein [Pannonibacter phragmitetus]|uniref:Uncharacterized protein n=1 Tax=Pannonibacter phragmitetus TaxID=121719 RepID=A0A0U3N0F6_9HYPH|nr:hypothetical protein [Pannonibacter phragmitetus]ALV26280.1 hypothetical protein APZ00_03665 [Pannonibacter phragmitetus]